MEVEVKGKKKKRSKKEKTRKSEGNFDHLSVHRNH